MASSPPPKVCVIGAGPGGMFFCHALESQRRMSNDSSGGERKDAPVLSDHHFPVVTCFERASGPGGVWRAARSFEQSEHSEQGAEGLGNGETTNMYEALWTNGPTPCLEFSDYVFEEHFDHPLPVYMPRQPMLDYLIGRVTKHCPDFFEKYVKFNTSVKSVSYQEEIRKFQVVTKDELTGVECTGEYDKCIWAGGENGRPMIPKSMLEMFRRGGFGGRIIHSSDTADFENDVKGKRVLLIGGAFSAEDLALMAVKCNVEKIYISSRADDNVVYWTGAWPYDKVKVLQEQTPVRVTENGRCIQFAKTRWQWPDEFVQLGETAETELWDIDTVIFCTGYLANFDMLDEDLRQAVKKDVELSFSMPEGWEMKPNAISTKLRRNVEVGDCRWIKSCVEYPSLYRGLSIDNPAMMFLMGGEHFDVPLMALDVSAWHLAQFVTGRCAIPSAEEMRRENKSDVIGTMDDACARYWMDQNYYDAYEEYLISHPHDNGSLDAVFDELHDKYDLQ